MKQSLKFRKILLLLFLSFSLTSCLSNVEEETIVEDNNEENSDPCATITFSNSVKLIIDANCVQCHGNGGNFPNLTTFNGVKNSANIVKSVVASRRMPIGSSLAQDDIDAIVCWVNNGALNN
ncbi:c-type cytochrome [Polaribacter aquimarinus]|uniref:Cytochrome c domain-containing protein n=1 Tax=Polaribacter aquimarinus TaxID=2100726 RepID=A0A2U2JAZ7_9FLAO|nr:cytochrome c [Polaribacter aquimarinus]PWG05451.1 hypothetical protein DIS07_09490 [Polaribacter aquimarinus]